MNSGRNKLGLFICTWEKPCSQKVHVPCKAEESKCVPMSLGCLWLARSSTSCDTAATAGRWQQVQPEPGCLLTDTRTWTCSLEGCVEIRSPKYTQYIKHKVPSCNCLSRNFYRKAISALELSELADNTRNSCTNNFKHIQCMHKMSLSGPSNFWSIILHSLKWMDESFQPQSGPQHRFLGQQESQLVK